MSLHLHYCKPILFGVLVTVIICVTARPAEKNAQNINIPNEANFVQISKFNPSDPIELANDQRQESFSKKISNNSTESAGHRTAASTSTGSVAASALSALHIPVRVIYDAPVGRYAAQPQRPPPLAVRRNSKQRIFPEDAAATGTTNLGLDTVVVENDLAKFRIAGVDENLMDGPAALLKAAQEPSSDSVLRSPPEDVQRNDAQTRIQSPESTTPTNQKRCITKGMAKKYQLSIFNKILQVDARNVLQRPRLSRSATDDDDDAIYGPDPNNCTTVEMAEMYRDQIFDKLEELASRKNYQTTFASPYANALRISQPSPYFYLPDTAASPSFPYASQPQPTQFSSPYYYYGYYPPPPLPPPEATAALDTVHRQWGSPFAQYFPIVIRDPFQSILNSFSDLLEYGPEADVCQRKHDLPYDWATAVEIDTAYRTARSLDRRAKRNAHKKDNRGKYHYVPSGTEDGGGSGSAEGTTTPANIKRKDPAKTAQAKHHDSLGGNAGGFGGVGQLPSNVRGTDVGPQISKLIVRRGGVAIAGAGGIATAGSGGTAIVGPGGTAFTTPASSGGVAMVGPGGKVVKVSDLTDVLYGRTSNGNVAATGAGHTTFTTKDGQVFTTSDNTGGVALVNPNGGLFGVSDESNLQQLLLSQQQQQQQQLEQEQLAKAKQPNEVQLPAGARLLTTGPIIYYNPVYPAVAASVR